MPDIEKRLSDIQIELADIHEEIEDTRRGCTSYFMKVSAKRVNRNAVRLTLDLSSKNTGGYEQETTTSADLSIATARQLICDLEQAIKKCLGETND